jgi:hypothetical protein
MRANCDFGITSRIRCSESTGALLSSLPAGAGDNAFSTRGLRAAWSADGKASESDCLMSCRFGVKSASAAWRASYSQKLVTA